MIFGSDLRVNPARPACYFKEPMSKPGNPLCVKLVLYDAYFYNATPKIALLSLVAHFADSRFLFQDLSLIRLFAATCDTEQKLYSATFIIQFQYW